MINRDIEHDIKINQKYFEDVLKGNKTFEVRKNDRNFKVGDKLILKEWDGVKYTGRTIKKRITYILEDDSGYVLQGHVIMSIR